MESSYKAVIQLKFLLFKGIKEIMGMQLETFVRKAPFNLAVSTSNFLQRYYEPEKGRQSEEN